ncbi:TetR/AcrR family transcriptional regulator [Planococcus chinensis]|uniref:TetR/AcrR family transcriptional regulator n=1 Tax=Planococcus chinensis TaxID=272917 RepID=A0ABW4QI22_9BACL
MAMAKKDSMTERGGRTREKILGAAREVFSESGYKDTTVSLIASRAKIGYGTVYAHFPAGKDEVLLEIMEDIMGDFYEIATAEYTPASKEEAFRFTLANTKSFLGLASLHRDWLALFYEAFGQSEMVRVRWDEITERFIARIAKNVDIVKAKGLSRNPHYDSLVIAGSLYYPAEKYVWKIALGKNAQSAEEIAHNIVELYTYGLFK